ncbi:hypothetical protein QFZ27_001914 [Inquilinus ginsengisoli]|uniref:DUF4255 domain-containing protein n=1 Tax=Inquilinus ginsengisoli TaxID=363840 RepID=UPI003D19FBBD
MSNALAIASVTRLLKDLLNDAVINGDVGGQIGVDVVVSALPPDRVQAELGDNQPSRLNLFLHRVTPNTALANTDLPTRDSRHQLVNRPRLALDLHYLLTAYGVQELQAEILLGYAMSMLHETSMWPRAMIREALEGGVNGAILPPVFQQTDPAKLADQLELIKVTPQNLSLDDMSKIWTALQTNYRTTVAYLVSVVLIERDLPKRTALPVLSRGPLDPGTGRDAGVFVQPELTPATPVLTRISPPGDRPAMRLGDTVAFLGHHLNHGEATVRFTDTETGATLDLSPATAPTPGRLEVVLPQGAPLAAGAPLEDTGADPGAWRVGSYLADVVLVEAGRVRTTNRLPITLAPRAAPVAAPEAGGTRITVGCQPRILETQSVAIVAGVSEQVLPPLGGDVDEVDALFADLPPSAGLPVRLRVAGVDSLLIDTAAKPPRYDPTQLVAVP